MRSILVVSSVLFCLFVCNVANVQAESIIPNSFVGKWIEYDQENPKDTLTIKEDGIEWKRTDKLNEGVVTLKSSEYKIKEGGREIAFVAKQKRPFGQDWVASSDMDITLIHEGDYVIMETREIVSQTFGPLHSGSNAGMIGQETHTHKFKKAKDTE